MNRKSVYIILSLILGSLGLHAQETEVLNQTTGSEEDKPTVYMVANAHLDTQWRWDIRQTINEFLLNTVLQNFRLIEEYPEYCPGGLPEQVSSKTLQIFLHRPLLKSI